jgi:hypothetical protein
MDDVQKVEDILNAHSLKAQQSAYDRDTCVLAILSAREALMRIPKQLDEGLYLEAVLQKLDELHQRYHDSDGEFTSGRGVIGALRDDIFSAFKK